MVVVSCKLTTACGNGILLCGRQIKSTDLGDCFVASRSLNHFCVVAPRNDDGFERDAEWIMIVF